MKENYKIEQTNAGSQTLPEERAEDRLLVVYFLGSGLVPRGWI
jgi:hypothetical protein